MKFVALIGQFIAQFDEQLPAFREACQLRIQGSLLTRNEYVWRETDKEMADSDEG
jgi:hypothetical protein